MNIRELNKQINSKTLNETMAKKFGTKINIEKFTLEQLQDARNKIRTNVQDIETNESFGGLHQNETYSKNKLFLDVLNAAISEREDVQEGDIPAGLKAHIEKNKKKGSKKKTADKPKTGKGSKPDGDGDGVPPWADKDDSDPKVKEEIEEAITAVCKDCGDTFMKPTTDCENDCDDPTQDCWVKPNMKESTHVDEGKEIINNYFKTIVEGEEDKAELVMAAKDMVDRLTGWMEDTAEMQSESMLELADAIRDEMGAAQSETFTNTVKPALESLYTAMEGTRVALTQGVGMLTGEEGMSEPMGDEPAMDMDTGMEPDMEPSVGAEEATDDGMGAAAPAAGGEDEAGRAKRESLNLSRRLGTILSSKK